MCCVRIFILNLSVLMFGVVRYLLFSPLSSREMQIQFLFFFFYIKNIRFYVIVVHFIKTHK